MVVAVLSCPVQPRLSRGLGLSSVFSVFLLQMRLVPSHGEGYTFGTLNTPDRICWTLRQRARTRTRNSVCPDSRQYGA